jgi:hypothetical protein
VENFTVSNITMENVPRPFVITTFYMGKDKPEDHFAVDAGTPRFHNFLFSNITATGALEAGSVTGLREMPVEDIVFSNIRIASRKGFTCTSSRGIYFNDVEITPDAGPALILRNSTDIDTTRLRAPAGCTLIETNSL